MHAYFDVTGRQLGDLMPLTSSPQLQLNTAGQIITGIGAGVLDYLKIREQRKLEQDYLKRQVTPPASMLTAGAAYDQYQVQQASSNNMLPILLIGGVVAFVLMSRRK